jgi:predicted F0F1-ATPase subunit
MNVHINWVSPKAPKDKRGYESPPHSLFQNLWESGKKRLGFWGRIGWWIALPGLLGFAVSLWIEAQWAVSFPWRVVLPLLGISLGCLNAWWWSHADND